MKAEDICGEKIDFREVRGFWGGFLSFNSLYYRKLDVKVGSGFFVSVNIIVF